jgi:thioredoxin 1
MAWEGDDPGREPTREEIDRTSGALFLEFGATWCGYCRALAPPLAAMLAEYPDVRRIKVEDGPGKPLGRSFGVKLWPTLVFLRDGRVVQQLVRPRPGEVRAGLEAISGDGPGRRDG